MSTKNFNTTSSAHSVNRNQLVPAPSLEATARKFDFEELNFLEEEPGVDQSGQALKDTQAELQQNIIRLEEKRDEYVERLDLGASKIETARMQGKDVTMWEDYWIQLLHQYEAVCDKLRDLYTNI